MNWTYALERMPSDDHENRHVVRVTSKPRKSGKSGADANAAAGGKIDIRFFTNVDEHAIKVRRDREIRVRRLEKEYYAQSSFGGFTDLVDNILANPFVTPRHGVVQR